MRHEQIIGKNKQSRNGLPYPAPVDTPAFFNNLQ